MRLFELRRLSLPLANKVMLSYLGKKILRMKLVKNQNELIEYFNALIRLNVVHKAEANRHYQVTSKQYGDFYLRKPFSSDYKVFEQIFVNKEYQLLAELIVKHCPEATVTMIDGGANIGFTTIYLNHYLQGKKHLQSILVEPMEDNIATAKLNMQTRAVGQVDYELAGLHNKSCYLKIDHSFRDGLEWSVQIVESEQPTTLKAIQIQDIMKKYAIGKLDVLKLDIEGAEKFLFEDAQYAAGFLEKVSIIAIELHDEYDIAAKILHILNENGFSIQKYGEMHIGVKKQLLS